MCDDLYAAVCRGEEIERGGLADRDDPSQLEDPRACDVLGDPHALLFGVYRDLATVVAERGLEHRGPATLAWNQPALGALIYQRLTRCSSSPT